MQQYLEHTSQSVDKTSSLIHGSTFFKTWNGGVSRQVRLSEWAKTHHIQHGVNKSHKYIKEEGNDRIARADGIPRMVAKLADWAG